MVSPNSVIHSFSGFHPSKEVFEGLGVLQSQALVSGFHPSKEVFEVYGGQGMARL